MKQALLAATAISLLLIGCGHPTSKPDLIVFIDTTTSLNSDQTTAIPALAKQLVNTDREYGRVAVYPIDDGGETPKPILDQQVTDRASLVKAQHAYWGTQISNALKKEKGASRTCIMNTAEFVSQRLAARSSPEDPVDIVFITDMIEDCDSTPLGAAVRLNKVDIRNEIKRTQDFPERRINLSPAHIYMVAPPGYKPGSRAPRLEQLENFWRTFFGRCGHDGHTPGLTFSPSELPLSLLTS